MPHNFVNLDCWNEARRFVTEIYAITAQFPKEERYGLTSQLRRAAVSIPSNIAEGCGRGSNKQLVYFLNVAIASSCEAETQLYLALDLNFISKTELEKLRESVIRIRKIIRGFRRMASKA